MFENLGKVSFNIASVASYVYILSGQKFIKNAKNGLNIEFFEKWDILSNFQTLCQGRPTVGLLTTKLMKKMSNLLTESLFGQTVVARGVTRKWRWKDFFFFLGGHKNSYEKLFDFAFCSQYGDWVNNNVCVFGTILCEPSFFWGLPQCTQWLKIR